MNIKCWQVQSKKSTCFRCLIFSTRLINLYHLSSSISQCFIRFIHITLTEGKVFLAIPARRTGRFTGFRRFTRPDARVHCRACRASRAWSPGYAGRQLVAAQSAENPRGPRHFDSIILRSCEDMMNVYINVYGDTQLARVNDDGLNNYHILSLCQQQRLRILNPGGCHETNPETRDTLRHPLLNVHITIWNITIFNGKIHQNPLWMQVLEGYTLGI